MGNYTELENLIKELSQGREMAIELQKHLKVPSSSTYCDYLLHKILYSYDKALSMIENNSRSGNEAILLAVPTNQDSPPSLANDDSNQNLKNHASKKRKDVVKWTEKVKMCTETGEESQLEDEYNWRKYGQKDILGAIHPRGYYRCTHRNRKGCLATKLVQRSDENPTIFDTTYRRKHTCNTYSSPSNVNNPHTALPELQNIDPTSLPENLKESCLNIQTSLGVLTQTLGPNNESPFSSPLSPPTINPDKSNIFSYSDNTLGNYSTNILSPGTTSELSKYFKILTNHNYGGFIRNTDTLESEQSPIVAGISSTSTSHTLVTHFPFGLCELGRI